MDHGSAEVTRLLKEWSNGREQALDRLVPEIQRELRKLAAGYLRKERPDHTLQPTALVHEAYLRLMKDRPDRWQNRAHFCAIAAHSMRQILIERARARGAQKRWAGMDRVTLSDAIAQGQSGDAMLPALDEALDRLEQIDPEQARIIELRYFVGLSVEEAADVLGMSPATLKRRWALARPGCGQPVASSGSTSAAVTPNRSPGASMSPMPCSIASWS